MEEVGIDTGGENWVEERMGIVEEEVVGGEERRYRCGFVGGAEGGTGDGRWEWGWKRIDSLTGNGKECVGE